MANRSVKKNLVKSEIRFTMGLPADVHAALAESARAHRRSMNDEAAVIMQEKFFISSEKQLSARLDILEGRVAALEKKQDKPPKK